MANKQPDSEIVHIRMSSLTVEALREAAVADGRTLNNMVVRIVDRWLAEKENTESVK